MNPATGECWWNTSDAMMRQSTKACKTHSFHYNMESGSLYSYEGITKHHIQVMLKSCSRGLEIIKICHKSLGHFSKDFMFKSSHVILKN